MALDAAHDARGIGRGADEDVHVADDPTVDLSQPELAAELDAPPAPPADDLAVMLGYWYASTAVVGPPPSPPALDALASAGLHLDGRPGTRLPHVRVRTDDRPVSTLDLSDGRFLLLAGPGGGAWRGAFLTAASARSLDLRAVQIGVGVVLADAATSWMATFGADLEGALLVRPDGFVGWRSGPGEMPSAETAVRVLVRLLSCS